MAACYRHVCLASTSRAAPPLTHVPTPHPTTLRAPGDLRGTVPRARAPSQAQADQQAVDMQTGGLHTFLHLALSTQCNLKGNTQETMAAAERELGQAVWTREGMDFLPAHRSHSDCSQPASNPPPEPPWPLPLVNQQMSRQGSTVSSPNLPGLRGGPWRLVWGCHLQVHTRVHVYEGSAAEAEPGLRTPKLEEGPKAQQVDPEHTWFSLPNSGRAILPLGLCHLGVASYPHSQDPTLSWSEPPPAASTATPTGFPLPIHA